MAFSLLHSLTPLCLIILLSLTHATVAVVGTANQLSLLPDDMATSIYNDLDEIYGEDDEDDDLSVSSRRSLLWRRMRYYISYGALSANRVPCPPRSGRSYYTHNCWKARGPAHPYSRGCSTITRCRR